EADRFAIPGRVSRRPRRDADRSRWRMRLPRLDVNARPRRPLRAQRLRRLLSGARPTPRPAGCRACFVLEIPGERRRSIEDELHVLPSSIRSAIVEPPRVTPRRRRRILSAAARAASALNAPPGGARWATTLPRR